VIVHLADVHIRNTARETFSIVIGKLGLELRAIRDRVGAHSRIIVCVVGDVFHNRISISSENMTDCHALIDCLMECADDVIVIPGNHDANINNSERADLLKPIMEREISLRRLAAASDDASVADKCQLHYWSKSGWHNEMYKDLEFYVFSPLEHGCAPPVNESSDGGAQWKIALVHDFINGMPINGTAGSSGSIERAWLSQFNIVMCGHVHDYQEVGNGSSGPIIAYSGALAQMTIGESFDKGFIVWEFFKSHGTTGARHTHRFVRIEAPGALVKFAVSRDRSSCNRVCATSLVPKDAARIVVDMKRGSSVECPSSRAVRAEIDLSHCPAKVEVESPPEDVASTTSASAVATMIDVGGGESAKMQADLIARKLRAAHGTIDDVTIKSVLDLHSQMMREVASRDTQLVGAYGRAQNWSVTYLEWNNILCYANGNFINFDGMRGLVGLVADNRRGKSAIIDVLCLALFNHSLRGSAAGILRRGEREATLHCRWEVYAAQPPSSTSSVATLAHARVPIATAGAPSPSAAAGAPIVVTVHDLRRKWDVRGHTTTKYIVATGRDAGTKFEDKTGDDLKSTYGEIARSVGTFEDFVATALIPQHDDETFVCATDMKRRAMLSRLIGLDAIDSALDLAKARAKEHTATINALASVVQGASTQISKVASAHKCDVARLMAGDTSELRRDVEGARLSIGALCKALSELESIPAAPRPARREEDIDKVARNVTAGLESARARLATIEAKHTDVVAKRDVIARKVSALMSAASASNPLIPILEFVRARIAEISASLDQEAIMLSRATEGKGGCKLEDVAARMKAVAEKIAQLKIARDMTCEATRATEEKVRVEARLRVLEKKTGGHSSSETGGRGASKWRKPVTDLELEERRARLENDIDATLPAECACHRAPMPRQWSETRDGRESMLRAIECATFAPGVDIAPTDARTIAECVASARTGLDGMSVNDKTANIDQMRACALSVARDTIQIVRLCAPCLTGARDHADAAEPMPRADVVRSCIANHDAIAANGLRRDEIAFLNECVREHEVEECRAKIAQFDAVIARVIGGTSGELNVSTIPAIDDQIRANERAHAVLVTLAQHADAIRAVRAADGEITRLRAIEAQQVSVVALDDTIRALEHDIETVRTGIVARESELATLATEREHVAQACREYDEHCVRQHKITELRAQCTNAQAVHAALVGELDSFARTYDGSKDARDKIERAQLARHVCELYAMTIDTKTGIQYSLLTSILTRIGSEANALLEPVAGLQLTIRAGTSNTAVGMAGTSSVAASSSVSRTMSVVVRDLGTHLEHDAELCSGFQSFVINIALRRAFSRISVRPTAEFMIIDEGFGCLDAENTQKLCSALPELAEKFKFLLIVSHIESLNAQMGTQIVINLRDGGVSEVKTGAMIDVKEDAASAQPGAKGASAGRRIPSAASAMHPETDEVSTSKPAAAAKRRARTPAPAVTPSSTDISRRADGTMYCLVCNKDFKVWAKHSKSQTHTKKSAARDGAGQ
jgi:DNA repair exonuclease SbcCD nuclease subunit